MQKTQQNTQIKEDNSKAQKKKQVRFADQVMLEKKELKMTAEAQRYYAIYCDILQHFLDVRNKQIQKDKSKTFEDQEIKEGESKRKKVTFPDAVQLSSFTANLKEEQKKEQEGHSL